MLKMEFKPKYAWLKFRAFNPNSMHIILLPFLSYLSSYPFEFVCLYIHLPWGLELYLYLQQPAQNRCLALSSCSINIHGTDIIRAFHDLPSLQTELVSPHTHAQCSHWLTFIALWQHILPDTIIICQYSVVSPTRQGPPLGQAKCFTHLSILSD